MRYPLYIQSLWFSISVQTCINHSIRVGVRCASKWFTEGRFPWVLRLSCKSSFWDRASSSFVVAPSGSFPNYKVLWIKKGHNPVLFCLAWTKTWSQAQKGKNSAELSNDFKILWDSSAKQFERVPHKLSQRAGPDYSTGQWVLCKAEPAVLGLLNICPFFYILCFILLVKNTFSLQHWMRELKRG